MVAVTWEYRSSVMPIWPWLEQLADGLEMDAEAQQQRCGAVAPVVQAHVREPRPLQQRREASVVAQRVEPRCHSGLHEGGGFEKSAGGDGR
jgi:hypothetical protein